MTWQRTLGRVAAHFGAAGRVETRITCVDPKRQWWRYTNVRHNALVLSALHTATAPLRWIKRRATGVGKTQGTRNQTKGGAR